MNAWPLSISKRPDVRLYVQPSILGTWCFISVCGFWSIPGVEICWSGQWCILSHWLELYCWSSFFLLLLTLHRRGDIFWRSAERHGNCDTALQWTCKCLFLYVQSDGLYSSLINQLFQLSLGFFVLLLFKLHKLELKYLFYSNMNETSSFSFPSF